jgi:hypothetical protein
MKSYSLSKSSYIRGLQCLKSLYLNKNRAYLRDKLSEEQLAKFKRGHDIGKIAQKLFPGGIELPMPGESSARKTKEYIEAGETILYEACFIADNVIIAIDILVKTEVGWQAYEVKSSYKLSETYYNDANLQQYVIVNSGLNLGAFNLVYRNTAVEIPDENNISDAFIFERLNIADAQLTDKIHDSIITMNETLALTSSPKIEPGAHCMKPYPCDFRGVCWKFLSEDTKNELLNS